jgi:hypothetical protein
MGAAAYRPLPQLDRRSTGARERPPIKRPHRVVAALGGAQMLSSRRLAVTASIAAALAVPAAAQARQDLGGPSWGDYVPVSVEADNGFEWGDAAIGGGAAVLLSVLAGGAAPAPRLRGALSHE